MASYPEYTSEYLLVTEDLLAASSVDPVNGIHGSSFMTFDR